MINSQIRIPEELWDKLKEISDKKKEVLMLKWFIFYRNILRNMKRINKINKGFIIIKKEQSICPYISKLLLRINYFLYFIYT